MGRDRRKEITHHFDEDTLDEKLREASDEHRLRRLGFLKNLYQGDTIAEAADREGRSESTGDRWAAAWNEEGLAGLMPDFAGGRPPKLDDDQQQELLDMLREGQPWKAQEIHHLLAEEFDVEFHPDYLGTFLRNLGLSYAKPRPRRPDRPDDAEEILDERVDRALADSEQPHNKRDGDDDEGWVLDDDVCTDGGTVVGFFDVAHPQPYDNSQRVWYVDDPHIDRPLITVNEAAAGGYLLNGESVIQFLEAQKKDPICETFAQLRERNPGKRIVLVLDNFSTHVCEYTRRRAHQLGIDLVFLPTGSPHLNPIEWVWDALKRKASPIVVDSAAEFKTLITDLYQELTERVSFAKSWIDRFIDLQKLS